MAHYGSVGEADRPSGRHGDLLFPSSRPARIVDDERRRRDALADDPQNVELLAVGGIPAEVHVNLCASGRGIKLFADVLLVRRAHGAREKRR